MNHLITREEITSSLETNKYQNEENEIRRIATMYLLQKAGDIIPVPKEKIQAAIVYARLVLESSIVGKIPVRQLKTFKQMNELLRDVTGMQKIKDWLKRPNGKQIIEACSSAREFQDLWYMHEKVILFSDTFEKLKKAVTDCFLWFRIVDLILTKGTHAEKGILLKSNSWNKSSIALNFVIAATLGCPFKKFTKEELKAFIDEVSDYTVWRDGFSKKIRNFVHDPELCDALMQESFFQDTLAKLENEHRRSVLTLGKAVTWNFDDGEEFKEVRTLAQNAFRYAYRNRKKEIQNSEDVVVKLNEKLNKVPLGNLIEIIRHAPFLVFWTDETVGVRIAKCLPRKDSLGKQLSENNFPVWSKVKHIQTQKGMSYGKPSVVHVEAYVQQLLKTTIFNAPLTRLRMWIQMLYRNYAIQIPTQLFPGWVLVALYLTRGEEYLPPYITEVLHNIKPFQWIDTHDFKVSFCSRISVLSPETITLHEDEKGVFEKIFPYERF